MMRRPTNTVLPATSLRNGSLRRLWNTCWRVLPQLLAAGLLSATLCNSACAQVEPEFQRRSIESESNYSYQGTRVVEPDETPLPDVFLTRSAYVDRSVEFNYGGFSHLDGTSVDQSEFAVGLNYAINNRLALNFEAPYVFRNPAGAPNTSGFGDVEVGVQYILYGYVEEGPDGISYRSGAVSGGSSAFTRRTIEGETGGARAAYGGTGTQAPPLVFSIGMDVGTPTGNANRQLGEGFTSLAPQALAYWRVNEVGTAVRGQFGLEIPTVSAEPTEFFYNVALSQIFLGTQAWRRLNTLVGILEFNGFAGAGDRVYVTPGMRWYLTQFDLIGVAGSFPMTTARDFDSQVLVSYIHELPEQSRNRRRRYSAD
jgi:hypothetical protein